MLFADAPHLVLSLSLCVSFYRWLFAYVCFENGDTKHPSIDNATGTTPSWPRRVGPLVAVVAYEAGAVFQIYGIRV